MRNFIGCQVISIFLGGLLSAADLSVTSYQSIQEALNANHGRIIFVPAGDYTITDLGVCYPNTNFGCYQATIKGDQLEWFQDGKSQGTGTILKGNPLNF